MRKRPGTIQKKIAPIDQWKELANTQSWDIADAIRTTAVNTNPGRPVRMICEQGVYRVYIQED